MATDYDKLWLDLKQASQHKPDPRKGKTMLEWAKVWGKDISTVRRRLLKALSDGLWIQDKDWRTWSDERTMQVSVFRPKGNPDAIPKRRRVVVAKRGRR